MLVSSVVHFVAFYSYIYLLVNVYSNSTVVYKRLGLFRLMAHSAKVATLILIRLSLILKMPPQRGTLLRLRMILILLLEVESCGS